MNELRTKIEEAITHNRVVMHSRLYFVTRTVLFIAALVLALGTALFLASAVIFAFRANALHLLPFFGPRGWAALFFSLPWLLLVSAVSMFALLIVLSQHFKVSYTRPIAYTFLTSIVAVAVGGIVLAHTTIHERAYEQARQPNGLPFAGPLYRAAIGDRPDVHVGIISNLSGSSFVLQRRDGQTTTIVLTDDTRIHPTLLLANDMLVLVMGDAQSGTVTALGIRPAEKQGVLFPNDLRKPPKPPLPQQ